MAKRERSARRTEYDPRVTPKSLAAGQANLARGRALKAEARSRAKEAGTPKAKERWASLVDGSLSVSDLDDEEIKRMAVRGADGGFAGKRRAVPSHLAQQFRNEAIKRAVDRFRMAAPDAVRGLLDIAADPEAKHSDRIKAYSIILDRSLGRTPETIRVVGESEWDALGRDLAGLDVDRDLVDLADGEYEHPMGDA